MAKKSAKHIAKDVLREIKPSKQDEAEIKKKIDGFLKKLNSKLNNAKAILGGSGAKDTWLKDAHDADIFVLFDYAKFKDKSDSLSEELEASLKKAFPKYSRLHGSRDYFQVKEKGFTFEIIPILNIKNPKEALNITDISPLHAKWVLKHKKLSDDMRLMKKFAKAQGVYGAESYIKGLSGYVIEILTVYYNGFESFVKNAGKWDLSKKIIVDVEKYHKDVFREVNKSKLVSPLIVIDPVQKGRNAAAAVEKEKLCKFIDSCKRFAKNPSLLFFEKEEVSEEKLRKKAGKNKLVIIKFKNKSGKVDVVGAKLVKVKEFIAAKLKKYGFVVKEHDWDWDKEKQGIFWFIVDAKQLSKTMEWKGPPLFSKENVVKFKKKYKQTYEKKGIIYAKVDREFTKAEDCVKVLIKDNYVKEKVKEISC